MNLLSSVNTKFYFCQPIVSDWPFHSLITCFMFKGTITFIIILNVYMYQFKIYCNHLLLVHHQNQCFYGSRMRSETGIFSTYKF